MTEAPKPANLGQAAPPQQSWKNLGILLLVIAAFVATYYLGRYRRVSRMDAFARCLTQKQARMYGAFWCPHCADQEAMFGTSFKYVAYTECGIRGSRAEAPECVQAGIKHFPTWQFADGERREGDQSLQVLSQKTGCALP